MNKRILTVIAALAMLVSPAFGLQYMQMEFQDLDELARYCLQGIREKRFVIMIGVEDAEVTLQNRAARIGRSELPIDLAEIPQL